jgi:Fe(3+) dicitrate transport protein
MLIFGYKGTVKKYLSFDIGIFYLHYGNRIGTITQNGGLYKTNLGTSVSKGIESYVEVFPTKLFAANSKYGELSIFAANSLIDARYVKWNSTVDPNQSIENNQVENAPQYIHRFGANYHLNQFSCTYQLSSIGEVFSDAMNTLTPNATGTIGKILGYQVMDASLSYQLLERYNLKIGVNNLADEKYATRRASGYPGPGLIPGNGRSVFFNFGATF